MTAVDQPADDAVPDLEPWVPVALFVARAVVVAYFVVNILNAFAIIAGPREAERYWYLLAFEANPATWLSVTMLTGTALLGAVCWRVDHPRRRPFWVLVATVALAMSLDDASEVHERVGGNLGSALGDQSRLEYLWVLPWGVLALVLLFLAWRFRPRLPTDVRTWLAVRFGVAIAAYTMARHAHAVSRHRRTPGQGS